MRGPLLADTIDYAHAERILNDPNSTPHDFMAGIIMGQDVTIMSHMLIPTIFGHWLDQRYLNDMQRSIDSVSDPIEHLLLYQQSNATRLCVHCLKELPVDDKRPYQAVVRLVGGRKENQWNYDWVWGCLCRSHQTRPHYKLLYMDDTNGQCYLELSRCLSEYTFDQCLKVEHFLSKPPHTKSLTARLEDALTKSYISILHVTNMDVSQLICERIASVAESCYHCGSHNNPRKKCGRCKIVSFCTVGKCNGYASIYHEELCVELRNEKLEVFELSRIKLVVKQ